MVSSSLAALLNYQYLVLLLPFKVIFCFDRF